MLMPQIFLYKEMEFPITNGGSALKESLIIYMSIWCFPFIFCLNLLIWHILSFTIYIIDLTII